MSDLIVLNSFLFTIEPIYYICYRNGFKRYEEEYIKKYIEILSFLINIEQIVYSPGNLTYI